jgi:hypothetical protein
VFDKVKTFARFQVEAGRPFMCKEILGLLCGKGICLREFVAYLSRETGLVVLSTGQQSKCSLKTIESNSSILTMLKK